MEVHLHGDDAGSWWRFGHPASFFWKVKSGGKFAPPAL
jgi:hypothetical protein